MTRTARTARTRDLPAEATRVSDQPATVTDQRLVQRTLARWQDWRCGEEFPERSNIVEEAFGEDWKDCFILDCRADHPFPVFERIGSSLATFSGIFLSGTSDWTQTLLDKATSHVGEVMDTRDAVLIEEVLRRFDGERLAFRCILLPLSDDGVAITHVLGSVNGKLLDGSGKARRT
jgi:hypothetical protein